VIQLFLIPYVDIIFIIMIIILFFLDVFIECNLTNPADTFFLCFCFCLFFLFFPFSSLPYTLCSHILSLALTQFSNPQKLSLVKRHNWWMTRPENVHIIHMVSSLLDGSNIIRGRLTDGIPNAYLNQNVLLTRVLGMK